MNSTKKSAADATAVATKHAAKKAAKQPTAEQPEAKQKTKEKKKTTAVAEDKTAVVAEQGVSADDAVPVEATKEEATVQVCGTASPQWQGPIARLGYGLALCKANKL